MTIRELGHIVLYVRDLERSRRFYGDVLGWGEIVGDVPDHVPSNGVTKRVRHEGGPPE